MTEAQVAALEQWAKQERDYATEMGGTGYTSVNKLRDVLALCASWREKDKGFRMALAVPDLIERVRQLEADLAHARAERLVTLGRWSEAVVTALEADRSKAEATIATLREQLAGFAPYLKEGETPLERLTRERADNDALLTLLARAKGDVEAAQAENATLRAALTAAQMALMRDIERARLVREAGTK